MNEKKLTKYKREKKVKMKISFNRLQKPKRMLKKQDEKRGFLLYKSNFVICRPAYRLIKFNYTQAFDFL